jgi:P4 family phage/plasmid primase-like protien
MQELDKNSMLLCFNNGVVDFAEKTFRRGLPEDYVSKSTNIDFFPFDEDNPEDVEIQDEIETFMHQLFPDAELYTYMWEHLASVLLGTPGTQCFHMYIGGGQNGKSVLISLMEMILGEYKSDVPLSLVTDRRTKIGGLAPEIVALRGTRYAVMQEPSKGDKINEGVMKQLTSGLDPIQARAPYAPQMVTFTPQFKLVLAANEFMKIASQDHGTWRRIRVVDFKSLFTDTPVEGDARKPYQFKLDRDLKERQFPRWKRVFVSLLVKKAMETQGKVQECEMVMASSESYRKRQDMFAEYIDCCVARVDRGNSEVKKAKLTTNFNVWWRKNYPHTMSPDPKELHDYMDKQFDRIDKNTWRGIRLLDPDGDDNQPMDVPGLEGEQQGRQDVVEDDDIVMNTQYY